MSISNTERSASEQLFCPATFMALTENWTRIVLMTRGVNPSQTLEFQTRVPENIDDVFILQLQDLTPPSLIAYASVKYNWHCLFYRIILPYFCPVLLSNSVRGALQIPSIDWLIDWLSDLDEKAIIALYHNIISTNTFGDINISDPSPQLHIWVDKSSQGLTPMLMTVNCLNLYYITAGWCLRRM